MISSSVGTSFLLTSVFIATFARLLGTSLFLPLLGGAETSKLTRTLLALALTALVFPTVLSLSEESLAFDTLSAYSCLVVATRACVEFFLGVSTALILQLFFNGVYLAGELVGRVGGVSVAGCFDPTFGDEVSPVSRLIFWCVWAFFLAFGGLELFIDGYLESIVAIVPGTPFSPEETVVKIVNFVASGFELGFKVAAPLIASSATVFFAVGVLGRIAPGINLTTIGFNLNSLVTLAVLAVVFGGICRFLQSRFVELLDVMFLTG